MKRLSLLIALSSLVFAACAPAAAPAPTQAPAAPKEAIVTKEVVVQATSAPAAPAQPAAQPTFAPRQTEAPAAAAPAPTSAPLATGLPNLKPPPSGGVLNPPTLIPTTAGSNAVTSGQTTPNTWRDPALGLAFQYPAGWQAALDRNRRTTLATIILTRTAATKSESASMVIEVRSKQGDLLAWLGQQLPTGQLRLDAPALEGGAASYKTSNARLAGRPAVFLYAPAHGATADAAALHTADERYFYQFTYLGSRPDRLENRSAFARLLSTVTLSGTTRSGITLPASAFTAGIDLTTLK